MVAVPPWQWPRIVMVSVVIFVRVVGVQSASLLVITLVNVIVHAVVIQLSHRVVLAVQ